MRYLSRLAQTFVTRDESNIHKDTVDVREIRQLSEVLSLWIEEYAQRNYTLSKDDVGALSGLTYDTEETVAREYDLQPDRITELKAHRATIFFREINPILFRMTASVHSILELDAAMHDFEQCVEKYWGEEVLLEVQRIVIDTRDKQIRHMAEAFGVEPIKPKPAGEVRQFKPRTR